LGGTDDQVGCVGGDVGAVAFEADAGVGGGGHFDGVVQGDGGHPTEERVETIGGAGSDAEVEIDFCGGEDLH